MATRHAVATTRSTSGLVGRALLTLVGAAGLVIGAFLDWWKGTAGTDLTNHVFWQQSFGSTGDFVQTAGFVSIVLGLLAVIGLAAGSGMVTRLAGVLAIAAAVLFGIEVFRAENGLDSVRIGAWMLLAGGVVTLIAGFLGTRPIVVAAGSGAVDEYDD
jgi:hypothetical protein